MYRDCRDMLLSQPLYSSGVLISIDPLCRCSRQEGRPASFLATAPSFLAT